MDPELDNDFSMFLPGQKQEDDASLIVEFFVDKKLLGLKSIEAGREIFEDREFVRIRVKGQQHQVVVEEVKHSHKQRFPIAYRQFLSNKPAPVVGTPVEQLTGVGPSFAHRLKGLNIRTIEDLGGITDESAITAIGMGAREWIRKAKAWVEHTTGENQELREALERAKADNAAILERLSKLEERAAEPEAEKRPTLTLKKGSSP